MSDRNMREPSAEDRKGYYDPSDLLRVFNCDCGETLHVTRHNAWSVDCECGRRYNGSGQRLRSNWDDNPSCYDDEVGDMEGYESSIASADYE